MGIYRYWRVALAGVLICGLACRPSTETPATGKKEKTPKSAAGEVRLEWKTITRAGVRLSVPYSAKWNKEHPDEFALFDTAGPGFGKMRFGRPIKLAKGATREYALERVNPASLAQMQAELGGGCAEKLPASIRTVAQVKGVRHYREVSGVCAVGFAFERGDHAYHLYRLPTPGKKPPKIDAEMRRIVKSLREIPPR